MPIHSVIKAPAFLISKIIFHPSDMRNVCRQKTHSSPANRKIAGEEQE